MRQFTMSVRRHGPTGMQVRIDQRPERLRAFEPRVQIKTKLARQGQVGTLPGSGYDPVDRPDPGRAVDRLALGDNPVVLLVEREDSEPRPHAHAFAVDQLL